MGKDSKIEWCTHTGNMWWGCVEVHEGCDHCYARTFDKRVGGDHWGAKQPRRAVAGVWNEFKKWQKKAAEAGEVHRVFVGSMMDIFERSQPCVDYYGKPLEVTTGELRQRFFDEVVPNSPNLLFLLLTKRPQNITKMVPAAWLENPPNNVMYGTSVVNQVTADRDIPILLKVPGRRFLSIEPLLGPVDLSQLFGKTMRNGVMHRPPSSEWPVIKSEAGNVIGKSWHNGIDWVIVGGESGHHARPMHPQWVRDIRDQCLAADVPFLFKQWGEWATRQLHETETRICVSSDGSISHDASCRFSGNALRSNVHWHPYRDGDCIVMSKVGKHAAGRLFDGRTWDQFPEVAQ